MRFSRILAGIIVLGLALFVGPTQIAYGATLTVDSTADTSDFSIADGVCDTDDSVGDGPCTLRAAIEQANFDAGTDTITFDIAGTGPHTITPGSALPTITDPVIIDGTSEPDFAGTPIVELDGTSAGAMVDGLNITAGSSTVKGLVINRFSFDGIELSTNGGNTVEGNYIGTNVSGTVDLGNGHYGVYVYSTSGNTIGGAGVGAGNVISGNKNGVLIHSEYIGEATGNQVLGNYIGTDKNGIAALGNSQGGVWVYFGSGNTIGGTAAGAGNVISGNTFDGVAITGSGATGNLVQGNYIGTDVTGTADLGNTRDGVMVWAPGNTIGGTAAGAGNVISGNTFDGVVITGLWGTGNEVQGNYIGTDKNGTADLGNGNSGVRIESAPGNTIGGTTAGAGNVISGNTFDGVVISTTYATGNLVQGNYIGTQMDGVSPLGNISHGVHIVNNASDNTIGGPAAGAGNTIAFNGGDGVYVASGTGNLIDPNSIHSNGGLGIDLGTDGTMANDVGDGDSGANNLQNFPALTSALVFGSTTTIKGSLNSSASTGFTLEFFSNAACDISGNGEGETFVVSSTETTNGSGDVTFTVVIGSAVPLGRFMTATATDPGGNTSEFSACEEVLLDSDGDGVPDTTDNCPDTANPGQENNDLDSEGDACDPDDDNDTVLDGSDNCQFTPNPGQENAVHPGTPAGDHCEDPDSDLVYDIGDVCPDDALNDADGDGICVGSTFQPPKTGGDDNCPAVANSGQENAVHPGTPTGDHCEDPDSDLVFDVADNCPDTANPGQENNDLDSEGDACDPDDDNDTVLDGSDNCQFTPNPGQENAVHPGTPTGDHCEDPDSDLVFDVADNCPDTDNPGQENTDGDGYGDACDNCPTTATLWLVPVGDSDCDSFTDAVETFIGTDSTDSCANTAGADDEADDRWPADTNDNQFINVFDVVPYIAALNSVAPNPPYLARLDLNMSGDINVFDVVPFIQLLNKACLP